MKVKSIDNKNEHFDKIYDIIKDRSSNVNDYLSYVSFLMEVIFIIENSITSLSKTSIPEVKEILIKIITLSLENSNKEIENEFNKIIPQNEFLNLKINKDFINTINLEASDVKKEALNKLKHFKNILNKTK